MAYCFFLDELMIPVPPEKMVMRIKGRNKTLELINEGEVNILRSPGLTEIAFEIRLPGTPRPYADFNSSFDESALNFVAGKLLGSYQGAMLSYKGPEIYLAKLKRLKNSKEPFNFVVTRDSGAAPFNTCMSVTLEEYSIVEDAGEGFDITVPVTLKQFRDYTTKELSVSTDENGKQTVQVKQNRRSTKGIAKEVKVGREKSMWEVVQRATGGTVNWQDVMKFNSLSNPTGVPAKNTSIRLNSYKSKMSGSVSDTIRK